MIGLLTAVLLWLGLAGSGASEMPMTLESSVTNINKNGLEVTVNCAYNSALAPSTVGLVSLTVSHRSSQDANFTETASVNSLSSNLTTADGFTGAVHGVINNTGGGASSLTVKFPGLKLSETAKHQFRCHSSGINRFGHCIETVQLAFMKDIGEVISSELKKIGDLQGALDIAEDRLSECSSSSQELVQLVHAVWKEKHGSNFLWASEVWNDTIYAVFKDSDECVSLGGYLAEVNTLEEFEILEDFIRKLDSPDITFFLTGAYFEVINGPFIFKTHPGDPMYLGRWSDDELLRYGMAFNNLLLKWSRSLAKLQMAEGRNKGSALAYLCEVPLP